MICICCQDGDHDHCLNFGVWQVENQDFENGNGTRILTAPTSVFKRRDEPTKTWCDCQHEDITLAETVDQATLASILDSRRTSNAPRTTGLYRVHRLDGRSSGISLE